MKRIFFQRSFGVRISDGWINASSTPEANPTLSKCDGMLILDPVSCVRIGIRKSIRAGGMAEMFAT
jgi:hypothetical protein